MVLLASNFDKSKYLKAADLDKEKKFRIKSATDEVVGIGDDKEHRLVLWFTNDERGLVLNRTNIRTLREAFGDVVDSWIGKVIAVYPTSVDFRGKLVPALRVRIPPPKQPAAATSPQPASSGNGAAQQRRRRRRQQLRPIRSSSTSRRSRCATSSTTRFDFDAEAEQPTRLAGCSTTWSRGRVRSNGRGSGPGYYHDQANDASARPGEAAARFGAADRAAAMVRMALDPKAGREVAKAAISSTRSTATRQLHRPEHVE